MRRLFVIALAGLLVAGAAVAQPLEPNQAGPLPVDPPAGPRLTPPPIAPPAPPPGPRAQAEDGAPAGEVPLEIVLQDIRKDERGELVDAREIQRSPDGSRIYRVKWRTPDGRVYFYTVDGATGKILSKR